VRDRYSEFQSKGANVAIVGMGLPAMAADFRDEYHVPFPVLVDAKRQSYKALELKRGSLGQLLGKGFLGRLWAAARKYGVGKPKAGQDVAQLGGAVVVKPGGTLAFVHRAQDSSDNVPVDALLKALG